MHFYDPPKKCLKPIIQLNLGSVGHGKTFGGMVGRCMPNSGHGGTSGTRFMTIFGSYVVSHFPNMFDVYGGI